MSAFALLIASAPTAVASGPLRYVRPNGSALVTKVYTGVVGAGLEAAINASDAYASEKDSYERLMRARLSVPAHCRVYPLVSSLVSADDVGRTLTFERIISADYPGRAAVPGGLLARQAECVIHLLRTAGVTHNDLKCEHLVWGRRATGSGDSSTVAVFDSLFILDFDVSSQTAHEYSALQQRQAALAHALQRSRKDRLGCLWFDFGANPLDSPVVFGNFSSFVNRCLANGCFTQRREDKTWRCQFSRSCGCDTKPVKGLRNHEAQTKRRYQSRLSLSCSSKTGHPGHWMQSAA